MFIRRNKKNRLKRLLDFIWPSIGFTRAFKYIVHRLGRLPATPYQIAGGVACGAAISFTPFIGLHFILSAIMAYSIRSSVIASAIGTAVGNPLTFPFIWALTYKTGAFILSLDDMANVSNMFSETLNVFGKMNQWYFDLFTNPSLAIDNVTIYLQLWYRVWEIIFPLLLGCLPWVLIVWSVFFFTLRPFLRAYRKASEERRTKRHSKK